jgi:hypothetical protein
MCGQTLYCGFDMANDACDADNSTLHFLGFSHNGVRAKAWEEACDSVDATLADLAHKTPADHAYGKLPK